MELQERVEKLVAVQVWIDSPLPRKKAQLLCCLAAA